MGVCTLYTVLTVHGKIAVFQGHFGLFVKKNYL